jgi:class 3 adenylate cyclase/predicted metal-dependent HD superfamily phosphohydrolase
MDFYTIFYKSKTFFLYTYVVCHISLANIYAQAETDKQENLPVDSNSLSVCPQNAPFFYNTSLTIGSAKDSILFVFEHKKNFYNSTEYSFKIGEIINEHNQIFEKQLFDWSGWSESNAKKYALAPGNYIVFVKVKSDSFPEHVTGYFPVGISHPVSLWWLLVPGAGILFFFAGRKRKKSLAAHVPVGGTDRSRSNWPVVRGNRPDSVEKNTVKPTLSADSQPDRYPVQGENGKYEKPFFQKIDMVTVLFADIEGFSEITDSMEPEVLLDELNSFFFYFDTIVDRYHIEKIKTMGDAYMCAGGIPKRNSANPVEVVLAAWEVQSHFNRLREKNPNVWSVRIGIHTGQVMAGMLGHKKMSYDIWGHTVNIASRLESACRAGKINISEATYGMVKHFFDCERREMVLDKPESRCTVYYVKGLKPQFTAEDENSQPVPNRDFFIHLQLLRLNDLEEHVKNMMDAGSSNLFFHNFKHTRDVYEQAELLGHSETLTDEGMLLVKTAALLHDTGYVKSYRDAQAISEKVAREILPSFQFTDVQIDAVCRLMKASHYESEPVDVLENIIHDANLMYYGRADFITRMMNLYHEQQAYHIRVSKSGWMQALIDRLSHHRFYTRAAEKFILVPADKQIADTEAMLSRRE